MNKSLALAGVLAVLSTVAFAHSLTVPFFRDDAPAIGSTPPASGSVGIIGAFNTTDTVVTMHVVYFQTNNNGDVIFQQASPFDLEPLQGISWRPIQDDPAENLGQAIQNVMLDLGDEGSARLIWLKAEGGAGALVGRYNELSSAGAFSHVLLGN